MKLDEGTLLYSPSDLIAAAACQFATLRRVDELLDRAVPLLLESDALQERAARLGDRHEERILQCYRERFGSGVVEIARPHPYRAVNLETSRRQTVAAFAAKAPVVYQAAVIDDRLTGFADFITLTDTGEYEVADAKLARRAKVSALLQIAAYADVLAGQGVPMAATGRLLLGDGTESVHPLAETIEVYRDRRRRFQDMIDAHRLSGQPADWDDDRIGRCGSRDACGVCATYIADSRDLKRVAGMRMAQRAKLRAAGIRTIDDLAAVGADRVPADLAASTFDKLRAQAVLQVRGESSTAVQFELLADHRLGTIPPLSEGDIFFDFEGDPLWQDPATDMWGLEYLFGVVEAPAVSTTGTTRDDPRFRPFWAHDRAQERQALIDFLEYVRARRAKYPDLHIYHYASYEKTALLRLAAWHGVGESVIDDLLRDQVLVDLFTVVRGSIRVSQDSYGLKSIEPLYMGEQHREGEVTNAGVSVVAYAEYCEQRDVGDAATAAQTLDQIADYNRYDCISTLRLRDWLLSLTGELPPTDSRSGDVGAGAVAVALAPAAVPEVPDPVVETLRSAAGEPGDRSAGQTALALLGAAVGYHRREEKPYWWGHFERVRNPVSDWDETKDAVIIESVKVTSPWAKDADRPRSNPRRTFVATGVVPAGSNLERDSACQVAYPVPVPAGMKIDDGYCVALADGESFELLDASADGPGELGIDPNETATDYFDAGEMDVDDGRDHTGSQSPAFAARLRMQVTEVLPRGVDPHDDQPSALVVVQPPRTDMLRAAIRAIAQRACEALPAGVGAGAAAIGVTSNLFQREPPDLVGGGGLPSVRDDDYVSAITCAARRLDHSTLAVQGPPGTGKTFTGAAVIRRLVEEHDWRIGVVAQSHATVENMLRALAIAGIDSQLVGKPAASGNPKRSSRSGHGAIADPDVSDSGSEPPWTVLPRNAVAGAFLAGGGKVLGGTAWTFCSASIPPEALDLLVIDEAGQFSLANTLAVSVSTQRMLLLGDPQQLPQVSQGTHSEPVHHSALGWISQGHTLRPEFGYFLKSTWRMHPAVTAVVSALAYDGRLRARTERTATRAMRTATAEAVEPGVQAVTVEHHGNAVASVEEAERVVELVQEVLTWQWQDETTAHEQRTMTQADVLVVAPFNAQVELIRRSLAAVGLGEVAVGTVDRYQGREAPVVIVSMTTSEPAEVPRGMDFVLSTNRLNVAISRAKWLAVVVHSPALTDYLPGKPDALVPLGRFLRVVAGQ